MAKEYREHSWQYNGVAPWSEIYHWCDDVFGLDNAIWSAHNETFYFARAEDLTVFLLRWS